MTEQSAAAIDLCGVRIITQDEWWDALECMPPERWHHHQGIELFHICERISGDDVSWYGRRDGRCVQFVDLDRTPSAKLAAKVQAALAA